MIAHSINTIRNVDCLIILDKGKLIDQGKPDELRYNDNCYKKMLEQ